MATYGELEAQLISNPITDYLDEETITALNNQRILDLLTGFTKKHSAINIDSRFPCPLPIDLSHLIHRYLRDFVFEGMYVYNWLCIDHIVPIMHTAP